MRLSGLSAGLWTKGVPVQFPVGPGNAWVAGRVSSWGVHERQPHIDVSLLFFLPSPRSKNK